MTNKPKYIKEYDVATEGINSYGFSMDAETGPFVSSPELLQYKYDLLLKGKVTDPELRKEIIKHSGQILKHRTTISVIVRGKGRDGQYVEGMFTIIGVEPDIEDILRELLMNKSVNSNEWHLLLEGLSEELSSRLKPAEKITNTLAPPERITIEEIRGLTELQ